MLVCINNYVGEYNEPGVLSVYFSQCEMHAYPQKKLSCLATMLKVLLNFKELESSVKPTFGMSHRISLAEEQETQHGELSCAHGLFHSDCGAVQKTI